MTVTATHPTAADLFAYSCGNMDRATHAETEAHVLLCSHCSNLLTLLPDAPMAKRVRKALRDVTVSDHTPLPVPVRRADP